jgi:uncharacterized membrane protein YGL010W
MRIVPHFFTITIFVLSLTVLTAQRKYTLFDNMSAIHDTNNKKVIFVITYTGHDLQLREKLENTEEKPVALR